MGETVEFPGGVCRLKTGVQTAVILRSLGGADSLSGVAWMLGKNNGRVTIVCVFFLLGRTWSRLLCAAV